MPPYVHRYKNPFFFQYQSKNFSANARLLSSAKKANADDDVKASQSETKDSCTGRNQGIFHPSIAFSKKNTHLKTPYETFQLRYHLLLTRQALLPSVSVSEHTAKAATYRSKSILAVIEIGYLPRRDILSELLIHHTAD